MFNMPHRPPTTGNGVSVSDCKEFMMSLEKELANVLKCKPPMKGMKNMGTNKKKVKLDVICNIFISICNFRGKY